jgi:membrane protein DedA with SNARE-associated domain
METKIIALLSTWGLVGTFAILFLSGVGLPVPEEVTLLAAGYVASAGAFSPWIASAVAVTAILLGDSVVYYIGRRWGRRALDGPLRRLLSPERVDRAEQSFHRRRDWFLFGARFLAGVRIVAYFTAGMLRVRYLHFILLDMAGALISGPSSIFLAYFLGKYLSIDLIQQRFHHYRNSVFVGVVLVVLVVALVRLRLRALRRTLLATALQATAPAPEEPSRELKSG